MRIAVFVTIVIMLWVWLVGAADFEVEDLPPMTPAEQAKILRSVHAMWPTPDSDAAVKETAAATPTTQPLLTSLPASSSPNPLPPSAER